MGEDVDGKGQDGSTPLRCAVQVASIIFLLLLYNFLYCHCHVIIMNMIFPRKEGHTCVVKILLDKGASLTDKVLELKNQIDLY